MVSLRRWVSVNVKVVLKTPKGLICDHVRQQDMALVPVLLAARLDWRGVRVADARRFAVCEKFEMSEGLLTR